MSVEDLAARVRAGDIRAIARAISFVEDEHPAARALLTALHTHAGRACLIGITGPPGAGKSTLVDRLATHVRGAGLTVGILAVDPSSPYSGGALLGDRIRMHRQALDTGVYIRSMATRGHVGGLAQATSDAALVLDAAGRDVIIIETVGVGQDEVDIVRTADVCVVVLVPGTGDDVQALKAGIMEIADIFVVNKSDLDGADLAVSAIELMLALRGDEAPAWRPPIVRTQATTGEGIVALWEAVDAFRTRDAAAPRERRRGNAAWRLRAVLAERFLHHVRDVVLPGAAFDAVVDAIAARAVDPWSAAGHVLAQALGTPVDAAGAAPVLDKAGPGLHDVSLAADAPRQGSVGTTRMSSLSIGIIGGSGLYDMAELTDRDDVILETPFGDPSGPYVTGTLRGRRVAFLARHGAGHRLTPSELNFRANIYGFKALGVERIISASAVGSLREHIAPLHLVVPDQFIDRTRGRVSTYFGDGVAGHVAFGDPVCATLGGLLYRGAVDVGATVHQGGTYVCMEGPAFSTKAESHLYRAWGADVIGMTNLQEAKLAREAEICYSTLALVTDFDCWHPDHDHVSVEMIIDHLTKNARTAQQVIAAAVEAIDTAPRTCACATALATAIITRREVVPDATRRRLDVIMGKYLS